MTRISAYFNLDIPFPMFRELVATGVVGYALFVAWEWAFIAEILTEIGERV